jgi:hypothetical protein
VRYFFGVLWCSNDVETACISVLQAWTPPVAAVVFVGYGVLFTKVSFFFCFGSRACSRVTLPLGFQCTCASTLATIIPSSTTRCSVRDQLRAQGLEIRLLRLTHTSNLNDLIRARNVNFRVPAHL